MIDPPAPVPARPVPDLVSAEQVCDAFEAGWRSGVPPRVEDFLHHGGSDLLLELIVLDVEYRRLNGETPHPEDYQNRFPGLDPSAVLAAFPAVPLTVGRRLGRFTLLERAGQGACGTVWKARDADLGRVVALKVPHPALIGSTEAAERFRREARVAAGLKHPGIVAVHDVTTIDGVQVLVADFVDGESLRDLLAHRTLDPREAAAVVADAAEALDHAHRSGAVHRDIKPGNLMVRRGPDRTPGRVVVVDFGLALPDEVAATLTADGQVVGTPAYMSPEQAAGNAHAVDARTDIYSLGAVLYEAMCGVPPFRGDRAALLQQVLTEEPAAPRRLFRRIPADLETICLRAMAKDPYLRYQTAGELADDLRRFLAGEPIRAKRAGVTERGTVWVRRHPVTIAGVAAGVVLLATLGAAVGLRYNVLRDGQTPESARSHEAEAELQRKMEQALYFHQLALASREWATDNLDRMVQLLDECPPRSHGWEWRYLHSLPRGALLALQHTDPQWSDWAVTGVAYSPDGQKVASSGHDRTLKIWNAADGRLLRTFSLSSGKWSTGLQCLAWSPDGKRLATGSWQAMVDLWDAETGECVNLFPPPGGTGTLGLAFSPDGSRIAAGFGPPSWAEMPSGRRQGGEVRCWEVASRREVFARSDYAQGVAAVAFSPDGNSLAVAEGVWRAPTDVEPPPGTVDILDGAGNRRLTMTGHRGPVSSVAWSPDGKRVATGSWDRTVALWDTSDGRRLCVLPGHRDWVRAVAFRPDGGVLASGGAEGAIRLWDPATGQTINRLRGHGHAVNGLAWRGDGARLASVGSDGMLRVWDPAEDPDARVLRHAGPVASLAWSPDGSLLLTACNPPGKPPDLTLWSPDGRVLSRLTGPTDRVRCVAFGPDGRTVAAAGHDRAVYVWSLADDSGASRLLFRLEGHEHAVTGLAFHPNGSRLYSTGQRWAQGTDPPPSAGDVPLTQFRVWDVRTGAAIASPRGRSFLELTGVAVRPDGSVVAASGFDMTTTLWSTTGGQLLRRFPAHPRVTSAVTFSPEGKTLVTGSWDTTVRTWDVQALVAGGPAEPRKTLRGHTRNVLALAFAPDGSRLATGSEDSTIKLWDPETGLEALTLSGHADSVTALAFRPNGSSLASASSDGTVRIWEAPP